jgi:hypothetical protein
VLKYLPLACHKVIRSGYTASERERDWVINQLVQTSLSTDGNKCDTPMFRGKKRLWALYLWMFKSHVRKYSGFFCANAFAPKQD